MPTPGERRALIFIAAVGALGVAVRGWKEFHPRDPAELAGSRTALARQIQAVDSAIAVSSSTRKARATRAPRQDTSRAAPPPRSPRARGRAPASQDTQPRDPRQAYWDRAARIDSAIRASDQSADERARSSRPQSADRRPPSQPPTAVRRPVPPSLPSISTSPTLTKLPESRSSAPPSRVASWPTASSSAHSGRSPVWSEFLDLRSPSSGAWHLS
jgi:hypothetical protein